MVTWALTEVESPSKSVHSDLRELHYDEPAHPIRGGSGGGSPDTPPEAVDLGIIDPGHLGEAGSVAEIVEEKHGNCRFAEVSLLFRVEIRLLQGYCRYEIARACPDGAVHHEPAGCVGELADWRHDVE